MSEYLLSVIHGEDNAVPEGTDFAAVRETRLDALGDLIADHADTDALWRLIESGVPPGLPLLPPGGP